MNDAEIARIRHALMEEEIREKQALCPDADVFKKVVTDIINPLAEQWTDVSQLDEAIAVVDELYAEMEQRVSQPHFPTIWSTHVCVQPMYQEVRTKLQVMRRLQIRKKIW
jgi:hypothetical protein